MTRRGSAVIVLLILLSSSGVAVPLCEYNSPLTDFSDLALSFSYAYHNDPYGLEDRDEVDGEFLADFVRLYDTPEYGLDIELDSAVTSTTEEVFAYDIIADGNYKLYFSTEEDFFAFAGSSARTSSAYDGLGVSFSLGIGCGRFTDVTPMAKATRIDEVLVDRGTLTDHLHPVDVEIMAHEIGSAATYESLADLLAVIQEIIEDSGRAALRGLDALDIAEITELVQDDNLARYCGWDVKMGLGYELLDPSGDGNDLLVTSSFNYAFATTPRVQFLVQGAISGPPNLSESNRIDITTSYDYLIWDFLALAGAYTFSRETYGGEPTDRHLVSFDVVLTPLDTSRVVLSVSFEQRPYYLEWASDVSLSISVDLL